MMALWPSRARRNPAGRAARIFRSALYVILAGGLGVTIHLGISLANLANEPGKTMLTAAKRPPGGSLVICGGGGLPDPIIERFLDLAGGASAARIVVIPTAHKIADTPEVSRSLEVWKKHGVSSVVLLHTRSRKQADDPAFVRSLTEATGVWLGGGVQHMLAEPYLGTEVERQLKALLARGGVIGGTSAGAAVMSRVMIASGRTSAILGEGFDFLPGTIIDQHFLKRSRINRLWSAVQQRPDLIGLGIDEKTALVVDIRAHRFSVVGQSFVVVCVPDAKKTGSGKEPSRPFSPVTILNPGDEADLAAFRTDPDRAVVSAIDFNAL
jgi:cyanophycinase